MTICLHEAIGGLCEHISFNLALSKRKDGKYIGAQSKRLQKRIRGIFHKQMQWVLEEMRKVQAFKTDSYSTNSALDDDQIDEVMRHLPYQKEMAVTIVASMKPSMLKGGKRIVKELSLGDFGINFTLENKQAQKFLGDKLSHELSNRDGNIHDVTTKRISSLLKDAARTGQSYSETAMQIRSLEESGAFSQARAEMIAVREIGIAYEQGKKIPVDDFRLQNPDRVVLKFWRTVGDDRVEELHAQNEDDGWIPYEDTFSGTGDSEAPASDNPRCRCVTEYKITA